MKANKLFSMGMILPLLAVGLYAGEAEATLSKGPFYVGMCLSDKTPDVVTVHDLYKDTKTGALSLKICVQAFNYCPDVVKSYQCWIKYPGKSDFEPFDCGLGAVASGYVKVPVKHGYNEVKIQATNHKGVVSEPLKAGWYVRMQTEAPIPQIKIGDKVGALPNNPDGSCNPLIIPIYAENGSAVHYVIGGKEYNTGVLNQPNAPAKPPYLVDYNLQTQGKTSLAPGETMQMTIWAQVPATKDKCGKLVPALPASNKETWTVICPVVSPEDVVVTITKGPPPSYASVGELEFVATGGNNPTLYCSLNGALYEPCTSPQRYSGLTAGEQVFRVYGTVGNVAEYSWWVYPPDVIWTQSLPADGTDTSAIFWFEAANGVDVPVTFYCRVDGGSFFVCVPPVFLNNLTADENGVMHSFEVYATSIVGTGGIVKHTWTVRSSPNPNPSPAPAPAPAQPGEDQQTNMIQIPFGEGCSSAAGMPLSFIALAGLWAAARRRKV